jgi:hypothetical protein
MDWSTLRGKRTQHSDEIAPGLEAIATGFGVILPDDHAKLDAQFAVYDALYAWCRLQVARGESSG